MDFKSLAGEAEKFLAGRNAQAAAAPGTLPGDAPVQDAPVEEQPAVTHNQPILAGGADGEPVKELVKLLDVCGFSNNTIAKGENADGILDSSVMADVRAFCEKHGITESDGLYGERVPISDLRGRWVGPATWQALFDEATKIIHAG